MAKGRGFRSRKGLKRQTGWVRTIFANQQVDDTPLIVSNLVEGVDWSTTLMNERATVMRLRGQLTVRAPSSTNVGGALFLVVYLTDQDTASIAPDGVGILDEDLLYMRAVSFGSREIGSVEARPSELIEVDVKAMRRITTDQHLRMVMIVDVASLNVRVDGYMSALVSRGKSA